MPLVSSIPSSVPEHDKRVAVLVDRFTLEKRRWRKAANDGTDFAVDLEQPCRNGEIIHVSEDSAYFIEQRPEDVIRIPIPDNSENAAKLGWYLGNQHLQIEVRDGRILLAHDDQLSEKLTRAQIEHEIFQTVFSPDPHSRSHHHH